MQKALENKKKAIADVQLAKSRGAKALTHERQLQEEHNILQEKLY